MSRFGFTPETFNVNAASSLSHEGPVFNDFRQLYETLNLSSFGRCKSKSSKKMSSVKFGDLSSDSDSDDDDMDFGRAASKRVALKKTKKMSFGDLSSDSDSDDDDDMDFGRVKKASSKAAEKTKKVATKKTKKASSDSDDEETDFGRVKKTSSKTAKKTKKVATKKTKKVATKKTKKASSDDEEMDFGKTAFGKKLRIVKNQAKKAMALHHENGITLKKAWAIVKKSK